MLAPVSRPAGRLPVQDADAYQQLLDRLERSEAIAGIREGSASKERGAGRPLEEVGEAIQGRADGE